MSAEEFRYPVAPLVQGILRLSEAELVYAQGVRRIVVPIEQIRAFAVRDRPDLLGLAQGQLVILCEPPPGGFRKLHRLPFACGSASARAALAALGRIVPDADFTGIPWEEAAPRLGVLAHRWHDDFLNNLSLAGLLLLVAGVVATGMGGAPANPDERLGYLFGLSLFSLTGLVLIPVGWWRARRRRLRGSS
jgi:hypothetical protein